MGAIADSGDHSLLKRPTQICVGLMFLRNWLSDHSISETRLIYHDHWYGEGPDLDKTLKCHRVSILNCILAHDECRCYRRDVKLRNSTCKDMSTSHWPIYGCIHDGTTCILTTAYWIILTNLNDMHHIEKIWEWR